MMSAYTDGGLRMSALIRKKSPRAPSMSLDDAIEKAGKIYDRERCHAAPLAAVASHIGYKNPTNGAALQALASLKYYGLLDRPKEGMGAISKQFEEFRFAPNESVKQELVIKWLKSPAIFSELLNKYPLGLPSEQTLKYDLIQGGFAPAAADVCIQVFLKSVEYCQYYQVANQLVQETEAEDEEGKAGDTLASPTVQAVAQSVPLAVATSANFISSDDESIDRIPVRLTGGRRAWIEIPTPFYEADKERLKKQIELLLTEDEEDFEDLI